MQYIQMNRSYLYIEFIIKSKSLQQGLVIMIQYHF